MKLDDLVGKSIQAVSVAAQESVLRLTYLDGKRRPGEIYLVCDGDCCSETWFSDVIDVRTVAYEGNDDPIVAVETIPLPEPHDKRTRQDCDKAYGLLFKTRGGGRCTVVFRNSSNGYYGGEVTVRSEMPSSVSVGQGNGSHESVPVLTWTKIDQFDDWTAPGSG